MKGMRTGFPRRPGFKFLKRNVGRGMGGMRTGPYRSRRGLILGVCRGLAEYYNLSVFWTRMVALGLLIFTGIWPIVGIYVIAALLLKREPVIPFQDEYEREFYDSYSSSREMAVNRLKKTYDGLNRRLQRMEDIITNREYDWERRLKRGL